MSILWGCWLLTKAGHQTRWPSSEGGAGRGHTRSHTAFGNGAGGGVLGGAGGRWGVWSPPSSERPQSRGDPWLSIYRVKPAEPLSLDAIQEGEKRKTIKKIYYSESSLIFYYFIELLSHLLLFSSPLNKKSLRRQCSNMLLVSIYFSISLSQEYD